MAERTVSHGWEQDADHSTTDASASVERARGDASEARRPGSLSGLRLGDYHLDALLGVGGMAEVYLADDLVLARAVAVKVLTSPALEDEDEADRFRVEARRVAAFTHPRIVAIYYAGEVEVNGQHLPYLVMPLLHESLREVMERSGRLPSAQAVSLALQIAEGLDAAHRRGLVHRDVKPENVLLDAEGQALLADFGIAREVAREPHHGATPTPVGRVLGTPEYMAPEQLHGEPVDQRADIYSLGVVLYEMLAGVLPFKGKPPYDYAMHALHDAPTPLSDYVSCVPAALEMAVLMALARDPAERYPSMAEFALALRRAITQHFTPLLNSTSATGVDLPLGVFAPTIPDYPVRTGLMLSPTRSTARVGHGRRGALWLLTMVAVVLLLGSLITLSMLQRGAVPSETLTATVSSVLSESPTTQAAGALPTSSTGPTPVATGTPHARAATPTRSAKVTSTATVAVNATATPVPSEVLDIAPTPLVLTPVNGSKCKATQTITNTADQTVGWTWQPPQVAGFKFQIDGGSKVDWPSATTDIPAGGQATLVVTSDCQDQSPYTISVHDSLGGQYTFTMMVSE